MPAKNIIPGQQVSKEKLQRSRELRVDMTPAEKILWQQLRANKLGVHFRGQQIIAGFIVDFYALDPVPAIVDILDPVAGLQVQAADVQLGGRLFAGRAGFQGSSLFFTNHVVNSVQAARPD